MSLKETYWSRQPDGRAWESTGYLNAEYRLTREELVGGSTLSPLELRGSFSATYETSPTGEPCGYTGDPATGNSAGTLNIVPEKPMPGSEFDHFEVQWPAFPGQWNQRLSYNNGTCQPTFELNPLMDTTRDGGPVWAGTTSFLSSPPGAIAVVPLRGTNATLFFNNARGYINILKPGAAPLERVEDLAMTTSVKYMDGEKYGVIAVGTITESSNRLEELKFELPILPDPVNDISDTTPGKSAWTKALDDGFNALDSANVRATVSEAMRATARALIAKLRNKRH